MGVSVQNKGSTLYLVISQGRKRIWQSLGLKLTGDARQDKDIYKLADITRSKREMQIVSGEWGIVDQTGGSMSLLAYARKIAEGKQAKDHLTKSLKYLEQYGAEIQLSQISASWIEDYQNWLLRESGLGKSTVSHYSAALRLVLRRAERDLLIIRNPAKGVRGITPPETIKEYLTAAELQQLYNTELGGQLGAEVKRAFLFAAFTGLRVSDLRTLTWADIKRDTMQLIKRQQKTGRIVSEPLHATAWELIEAGALSKRTSPVFPLLAATQANTNQYLKQWAERAGIQKNIGWHTARHTFATLALQYGADFYTVSKLLGHTKTQTTAVYIQAGDKGKRDAVDGLPGLVMQGAGNE